MCAFAWEFEVFWMVQSQRDMVKHDLLVISSKLKSASWNSKVRVQIHELRAQLYELRVQIHKLRVQIHELGVQIHELRV